MSDLIERLRDLSFHTGTLLGEEAADEIARLRNACDISAAEKRRVDGRLDAAEEEIERLREWRGLVESHNASCAAMCDMDRCGYRQYFENNGRRCIECPQHSAIDIPAHLGATHER